jgi:hypothetical protein
MKGQERPRKVMNGQERPKKPERDQERRLATGKEPVAMASLRLGKNVNKFLTV